MCRIKNIDGPFTVDDSADLRATIVADLQAVLDAVIPATREFTAPLAVALVGGFGRGEGGAVLRDGRHAPVNDYDFEIIIAPVGLFKRRALRRRLAALALELQDRLGMQIDLDTRTPAELRAAPPTIAWYEVRHGHKIVWGDERALDNLPDIHPENTDPWDGGFLLFNRSGGLLIAKKRILDDGPQPGREAEHFLIQIAKARMAWGDCVLISQGRYDASYARRIEIAREADFGEVPRAEDVRREYITALETKIRPSFAPMTHNEYAALYYAALPLHEAVMRWFERRRLGDFANWHQYARPSLHKIDTPPCRTSAARNWAKNLLAFGLPRGDGEMARYGRSLAERCASAMPLLLFGDGARDAAAAAKILRIADIPAEIDDAALARIINRCLQLWH